MPTTIKNGIVYINGKQAPKGYKVYSRKDNTIYRVGDNGKLSVLTNYNVAKAKRLSEQTRKIPIAFIGQNKGETQDDVRDKFWQQEPVLQHAVDSVAKVYDVDPDLLKYRINHEGFVDHYIADRNRAVLENRADKLPRGYQILNDPVPLYAGIDNFGLDDAGDLLTSGKVKLKGKRTYPALSINIERSPGYYRYHYTNEKGRATNPATGFDNADNFGITAGVLKYFKDKAKSDFPNASDYDLNRYSAAYFNRGSAGGKKWVNQGANGYNYKRKAKCYGGIIHLDELR